MDKGLSRWVFRLGYMFFGAAGLAFKVSMFAAFGVKLTGSHLDPFLHVTMYKYENMFVMMGTRSV